MLIDGERDAVNGWGTRMGQAFQRPSPTNVPSASAPLGRPCPKGVRFVPDGEKQAINDSGRNLEIAFGGGKTTGARSTVPIPIASNWSMLARSGIGVPLRARLVTLAKLDSGWRGSGSRSLQSASLRVFLEFWNLIRGSAVEPQITLTPAGHLQAIWRRNSKRNLDLEFVTSEKIYFGLFDGSNIHEGVDTANELAAMLLTRPSKPLKWH